MTRPRRDEDLFDFITRMGGLAFQIKEVDPGAKNDAYDQIFIWRTLDVLDVVWPEWEDDLYTDHMPAGFAGSVEWQTMQSWDRFAMSVRSCLPRMGLSRIADKKAKQKKQAKAERRALRRATAVDGRPVGGQAEELDFTEKTTELPVVEEKASNESSLDFGKLRLEELGAQTKIRKKSKNKKKKKSKKTKSTIDASIQLPDHDTVEALPDQTAVKVIDDTQVNDIPASEVQVGDVQVRYGQVRNDQVDDIRVDDTEVDDIEIIPQLSFRIVREDSLLISPHDDNKTGGLGDDAKDYDDCKNSDSALEARSIGGEDNDYEKVTDGGFADDVYEGDGDNGDGKRAIVYIDGELRYAIPGYESRKKPRRTLLSVPRFIVQNFFRGKFPGRPKCPDCRCKHPENDGYMLCSHCDFCHIGGDDECYHQHPRLRGTRPAKEKYVSKTPDLDKEAVLEADMEAAVKDGEIVYGTLAETVVDATTETVAETVVVPELEPKVDTKTKLKNKKKNKKKFKSKKKKGKPQFNVEPESKPVTTASEDATTQPSTESVVAAASANDGMVNLSAALDALNVGETQTSPKSPKSPLFDIPQNPFTTSGKAVQFDLVSRLEEGAKDVDVAPVEEEPIMFKETSQTEEAPLADSLLLETEPAFELAPADGEGGARLTQDNLSRVPHSKKHRHWASMSSLITSSSGASLAAFRRRQTDDMEKPAQKKAAKADKQAAKVVAERAAAEKAAEEAAQQAALVEAERRAAVTREQFNRVAERLAQEREERKKYQESLLLNPPEKQSMEAQPLEPQQTLNAQDVPKKKKSRGSRRQRERQRAQAQVQANQNESQNDMSILQRKVSSSIDP
ncbi:hypothetical protein SBRCBS47491_002080 [Sporothrix bragantina]|uniref:Uncharacterized protein n=1 Tax=Sporothrix bragantina TaxID=671064 RepID=A0ABP0B3Y1_9PEZI